MARLAVILSLMTRLQSFLSFHVQSTPASRPAFSDTLNRIPESRKLGKIGDDPANLMLPAWRYTFDFSKSSLTGVKVFNPNALMAVPRESFLFVPCNATMYERSEGQYRLSFIVAND